MIGIFLPSKQRNYMRICVLIDAWEPIWGGGQTHVWEICRRLVKRKGWEVDIFTRNLVDEKGSYLPKINSSSCKGLLVGQ